MNERDRRDDHSAEQLEALTEALNTLGPIDAPPDLMPAVIERTFGAPGAGARQMERPMRGVLMRTKVLWGLAAAAAVDTLIDGMLISAGFSANDQLGSLLAIALSLELLFLTLSVGVEFREGKLKWWQSLAVTGGIALLLMVGAFSAGFLLADASEATLAVVLSFGAAALIYLIAEELLVENVQAEESLFSTATLFSGFLALLILKLLEPG